MVARWVLCPVSLLLRPIIVPRVLRAQIARFAVVALNVLIPNACVMFLLYLIVVLLYVCYSEI